MFISDQNNVYGQILNQALALAGYDAVTASVLSVIDSDPELAVESKNAVRAFAFRMKINGHSIDGNAILWVITTQGWDYIGMPVDQTAPLSIGQREAIIGVIMAVSKSIIQFESARLTALADTDTTLPTGWNDPQQIQE